MILLSNRKAAAQEYIATNSFGIYLNGKIPAYDDMIRACAVGVDSGTIGIFDVKDDFELRHWFDKKWIITTTWKMFRSRTLA